MAPSRPTIKDVAARAGVSKSLVSLAMRAPDRVSPARLTSIRAAADALGYRPNAAARNLADRRSFTIGVLVQDLHNPISAEVIAGVQRQVRASGYHTMLVTGSADADLERGEIEKLLEFQVEGLIIIGHRMPAGARAAIDGECPTVIISRAEAGIMGLDSISNDDVSGARMAVNHLYDLGHRRIAHITGGSNQVALLRRTGYEAAMNSHGLTANIACYEGAFTDEGGYRGTPLALASPNEHSAIFVANDLAAVGALAAIAENGRRVPEDVSVIGYDGMALGALRSIGLTTIAQPLASMGADAADLLLQRIGDPSRPPGHVNLEPRLITRNTTSAVSR